MKYFTPELYVRFNEASDDEAEAVFDEWEQAGRRFRRRYKKIESQLPECCAVSTTSSACTTRTGAGWHLGA